GFSYRTLGRCPYTVPGNCSAPRGCISHSRRRVVVLVAHAHNNRRGGPTHQRESTADPIQVRIGVNAGEPIAEGGDLFGTAVTMASRIAGTAAGGEIVVSNVVRELVAGKGFLFADRGEFVAKGFEEPVRVYEVRWRDTTAS